MNKNKKEIVNRLSNNLSKISDVALKSSIHQGKESDWSLSIKCEKGSELNTLVQIFGLKDDERLKNLFEAATSGDGNEISRILTLHSSSLLAFLCFSNISKEHPISILDTEYVDVMFEVKNDVIDSACGNPSNIDVMLIDESGKQILFLESKFTEYLDGGRAYLSNRYKGFYNSLLNSNKCKFQFEASDVEVKHKADKDHPKDYSTNEYCLNTGKRTLGYLNGIKQAFSHLLGIATGPANSQTEHNKERYTATVLEYADKITFASIVYNCDQQKFQKYYDLYKSVFINDKIIKSSIREVVPKSENLDKLEIQPELLTYQQLALAKDKPDWLDEKVKKFYGLELN